MTASEQRAIDLIGVRVAVLGLARSGAAAARALLDRGASVTLLDAADGDAQRALASGLPTATAILGRADPADLAGAELVVTSPGVPWAHPWLEAARARDVRLWSEVELAYQLGIEPLIGITGTNGKTTTTEMVAAILRADGRNAAAAGNVGAPLIEADPATQIVAELSSFQLAAIQDLRVPVAVLLNLGHDHLDWHPDLEHYGRSKARIFENQRPGDTAIVYADPLCGALAGSTVATQVPFLPTSVPLGGAGVEDGMVFVPHGEVIAVEDLPSTARPFVADAVAAAAACAAVGVEAATIATALRSFRLPPHRLEMVATIGGVTYIDDSKATDPHATLAALEARRDVVLIAGGLNKGLDLTELRAGLGSLKAVVAIGAAAAEVVAAFEGTHLIVMTATDMEGAVAAARDLARDGDTVLLSPACASFDMFSSYAERGDAFRAAVEGLEGSSA